MLKLVHAHSVKTGRAVDWQDPNWSMLDMGGYGPGAAYLLGIAIEKNDVALATWLLQHGASPNAYNDKHPRVSRVGSLYAFAMQNGRTEIAELLLRHGAKPLPPALEGEEAFIDACLRLDRDAMQAQLDAHPEYLQSPPALFAAATRNRADVVRLLLDLGTPIEVRDRHNARALHHAAAANALDVARLLIERGAEIDPRESQWGATPVGWAAHGDRVEMVGFLSRYTRDVWTLSFRGYVDRLREVLHDDPSLAKVTAPDGTTPLWWLPDEEDKALDIVELFVANGADPSARNKEGETAADWARQRGMLEVARKLAAKS